MIFEEALKAMREGKEVALDKITDIDVYRMQRGVIQRMDREGVFQDGCFLNDTDILSTDWYVRG